MDLTTIDPNKLVPRQTLQKRKVLSLHDIHKLPVGSKTIVLADISGSMHGHKMSCLRDALSKSWRPGVEGIAFESNLWAFNKSDIYGLRATGTTKMLAALEAAWSSHPAHIILLTDGYPDEPASEILNKVKNNAHIPIDTVAIGDTGQGSCDKDLLRDISAMTGGKFNDVGDPLQLTATMTLLLSMRPDELTVKGGSIEL